MSLVRSGCQANSAVAYGLQVEATMTATSNQSPTEQIEVAVDPRLSAKAAGLRYVNDRKPGITRKRAGRGFAYFDAKGQRITDKEALARFKSLAIPPAWTDVWISPASNGHIQATGRDDKGRKQYRYHPHWREVRDETKYSRMIEFGHALPKIREQVNHDMAAHALSKEKVLATVVRLLETTYIRIGNEEYARTNKSYGLTTMRCRHIKVAGAKVQFKFKGKSGKMHSITVDDPRLARVVKRCQELPGQDLFQYVDHEGHRNTVTSEDVNAYLSEITGQHFTAKDFRTWGGTTLAAEALAKAEAVEGVTRRKHTVAAAIKEVSEHLGNTPSICRKSYVHPSVLERYMDGTMLSLLKGDEADGDVEVEAAPDSGLKPEERAVLRMLEKCLEQEREANAKGAA